MIASETCQGLLAKGTTISLIYPGHRDTGQ